MLAHTSSRWTQFRLDANWLQGKVHLGSALRKNTASAFGPELSKKLAVLVKQEKSLMRSIEVSLLFLAIMGTREVIRAQRGRGCGGLPPYIPRDDLRLDNHHSSNADLRLRTPDVSAWKLL